MSGQAESYYNPNQGFDEGQASYANNTDGKYFQGQDDRNGNYQQPANYQKPVNYEQPANYQQPVPEQKPPPDHPDNPPPYTFDDAFKIEKPKYNDIWAGLLVSP